MSIAEFHGDAGRAHEPRTSHVASQASVNPIAKHVHMVDCKEQRIDHLAIGELSGSLASMTLPKTKRESLFSAWWKAAGPMRLSNVPRLPNPAPRKKADKVKVIKKQVVMEYELIRTVLSPVTLESGAGMLRVRNRRMASIKKANDGRSNRRNRRSRIRSEA